MPRNPLLNLYSRIVNTLALLGLGRIPGVRPLYHFLQKYFISRFKAKTVIIDGHTLFLDAKDSLELSVFGAYEPGETAVMKDEVKTGNTVIDIGANIGYFSLLLARAVGPQGKVFAFEPFPDTYSILKKNAEVNGYKNIILVQKGISDKAGNARFYINPDNNGMHSLVAGKSAVTIDIETIPLDDFLKTHHGSIDFVKMDIEGAELSALKGMRNTLDKNKNVKLFMEFAPMHMKDPDTQALEILSILTQLGFSIHDINTRTNAREKVAPETLLSRYTAQRKNHTNILCIREN